MKKQAYYLILLFILTMSAVKAQTPPATWQEHWFDHTQLLSRVYYDNDLALYYDNDVNRSIVWPTTIINDAWKYTKRTYGAFGSDAHLYAIFHTNKYSGGHPSTYFDASHDYRNVIDCGPGPWTAGSGNDLDLSIHEIGHIVEIASKGVHNSPAFGIWGDSKWCEIYIYDVYKGLGRTDDATRWYNLIINGSDNFPRANTHWFKDWFFPLYSNYGGSAVLNKYFELLANYFPKNGTDYARNLNMGEFIHFWEGAAGVDLKTMATTAFGWTAEYETQYNQARIDFVFKKVATDGVITVYRDCSFGGAAVSLPAGDYTLATLKSYGINNDDISSIKVNSGFKIQLFNDDNFAGTTTTISSNDDCLVDNGFNDLTTSLKISANGVAGLNGTYSLQNRNSGLFMDVANNGAPEDGTNILQWTGTGGTIQQFTFTDLGNGKYKIVCVKTGKCVDVSGINKDNGANVQQWTYLGSENQKFIVQATDNGYYTLIAAHSSRIVEVGSAGKNAGDNIQQWDNNLQTCGQWKLIPVNTTVWSQKIEAESYSSMSGVQTEGCTEGGSNVGYIDASDWMAYNSVTFPTTGTYTFEFRVASVSGAQLSADLNAGTIQLGTATIPATGGWQNWQTVKFSATVNSGTYNLGVFATTGGWNFNWVQITQGLKSTTLATVLNESVPLSIYPNPAESQITINTGQEEPISLKVINLNGVVVLQQTVENGSSLDVSSLNSGVYIIQAVVNNEVQTLRFIKK